MTPTNRGHKSPSDRSTGYGKLTRSIALSTGALLLAALLLTAGVAIATPHDAPADCEGDLGAGDTGIPGAPCDLQPRTSPYTGPVGPGPGNTGIPGAPRHLQPDVTPETVDRPSGGVR